MPGTMKVGGDILGPGRLLIGTSGKTRSKLRSSDCYLLFSHASLGLAT